MDFESFVLAAPTDDLAAEEGARGRADAVEFRMDLAASPVEALDAYDGELPLIATNRVERQGGQAEEGRHRLEALRTAADHPDVAAIDLELSVIEEGDGGRIAEHARRHDTVVIASVHDFEATPAYESMVGLLERATDYGDVGKLAVTATEPGDALDLLRATWTLTEGGERVATMAMGEAGRHTRAVAPLYGSRIGYAPVEPEDATAPGQYDLGTLRPLVEQLRGQVIRSP